MTTPLRARCLLTACLVTGLVLVPTASLASTSGTESVTDGPGTTVTGELVPVVHDGPRASTTYLVDTGEELVGVDPAALPVAAVPGDQVRTRLDRDGEVVSARVVSAAPAVAATPTAHHAYIAVATNRGDYGATTAEISAYLAHTFDRWVTVTGGAISSFTQVGDIKTFAAAGTACQSGSALWDQVDDELFPGVSFGGASGNHLIVIQPAGCGGGVGTVGSSGTASGGRVSLAYSPSQTIATVMHEIGHNLGLTHARSYRCDPDCAEDEYGDSYSPMGASEVHTPFWTPAQFDSFDRSRLGLLATCEAPTLALASGQSTVTATYDLFSRGATDGTRGLSVTDPVDGTVYWFDWRNAAGLDSQSYYQWAIRNGQRNQFNTGVTVEKVRADGASSQLQSYPKSSSDASAGNTFALETAQTYRGAGLTLTVGAQGADQDVTGSAQVTVTLTRPSTPAGPGLPAQVGSVYIAGQPAAGATLTAAPSDWTAGSCYRYQWYVDGSPVAGARAATYAVPAQQAGHAITVQVTGQQSGYQPLTVTGAVGTGPAAGTGPVVAPGPVVGTGPAGAMAFPRSARPRVGGHVVVGGRARVRVHAAAWQPRPTTFRYRWSVGQHRIRGKAGARRVLALLPAYAGKPVRVTVTAVRDGYATTTVTSAPRRVPSG